MDFLMKINSVFGFYGFYLFLKKYYFILNNACQSTVCYSSILINNLYLDQEVHDFIDHTTEDVAVHEQGDSQIGTFVSFFKVKNVQQILIIYYLISQMWP